MKYCVFSKSDWLWLIGIQVLIIVDFLLLWSEPTARMHWWFMVIAICQPVIALLRLFFNRKRKGYVRLTQHGDDVRWEIV